MFQFIDYVINEIYNKKHFKFHILNFELNFVFVNSHIWLITWTIKFVKQI